MEFAALYNALGSKVTVIEMLPKILGPLDSEISAMLQKIYAKRGVEFHLESKVTAIDGNTVIYTDPEGNECRATGDRILVSVGRRANIKGLGLETIGVEADRRAGNDADFKEAPQPLFAVLRRIHALRRGQVLLVAQDIPDGDACKAREACVEGGDLRIQADAPLLFQAQQQ